MRNLETQILELIKPYIDRQIEQRISERLNEGIAVSGFTITDELPLSMKEFATRIGLSKSFLYQQVSKNKIPYHKRCGRLYFIPSEIRDWIIGPGKSIIEKGKRR